MVAAHDGGPDWAATTPAAARTRRRARRPPPRPPAALDPTVPAGTPAALFDTRRYDLSRSTSMMWQFPATPGANLKVRLYFANRYPGTGQVGQRVFDVTLDGSTVLSSFDRRRRGGPDGHVREVALTSDGAVDIGFVTRVENPMISAIDIVQVGRAPRTALRRLDHGDPERLAHPDLRRPALGRGGGGLQHPLAVTDGTPPFVWSVSLRLPARGPHPERRHGAAERHPDRAGTFASPCSGRRRRPERHQGRHPGRRRHAVLSFAPPPVEVSSPTPTIRRDGRDRTWSPGGSAPAACRPVSP